MVMLEKCTVAFYVLGRCAYDLMIFSVPSRSKFACKVMHEKCTAGMLVKGKWCVYDNLGNDSPAKTFWIIYN